MARIAPMKETLTEKVKHLNLVAEKTQRKGIQPLFIVVPVAAITIAATTFLTVRRLRKKTWF